MTTEGGFETIEAALDSIDAAVGTVVAFTTEGNDLLTHVDTTEIDDKLEGMLMRAIGCVIERNGVFKVGEEEQRQLTDTVIRLIMTGGIG